MPKRVLVTGSSRGIGFAIAQQFLVENWNVCVTGKSFESMNLSREKFDMVKKEDMFEIVDFKNKKNVFTLREKVLKSWGALDALIVNVGSGRGFKSISSPFEDNLNLFDTNFFTAYNSITILKDLLLKSKESSIIIIGSIASTINVDAPINYAMSKKALENLSEYFSVNLSTYGVRVNCVHPGHINVEDGIWSRRNQENPTEFKKFLRSNTLRNRLIEPSEIGDFVFKLCDSNFSKSSTGSTYVIDGGTSRIKFN